MFFTMRESASIVFISDIVHENISVLIKVIRLIIIKAFKEKKGKIKIMTANSNVLKVLKDLGFLPYSSGTSIMYCSTNEAFLSEMKNCEYFDYSNLDSNENI